MRTSTGILLNDVQLVGHVFKSDLFSILIQFRKYAYVFSPDVEKMYRRILIKPEYRKYQKIFWRSFPSSYYFKGLN